jgi:hypothetical protein
MFNDLLAEKVQYVVWQLPTDVPISQVKTENYKGKTIQFRNFLETTDYIIYFNKNTNSEITKKIEEFYNVCHQLSYLSNKNLVVSNISFFKKLSHSRVECWKSFSWKKPSRIKEILFHIQQIGKYIKPIIFLSDAIGGASLERKQIEFLPTFKVFSSPKPLEENDPQIISCSVCFENKKNILFTPCSHITCCSSCAQKCQDCPICRKTIDNMIEVFL